MKKILFFILTIIVITIGWGCSDCLDDAISLDYLEQSVSSNTLHFVTLQDVQNLTKALSSSTRRANSSMAPEIICYEDAEHDTLLYICDKVGGGWTIYSSDTRVPPIVAQSDSCSFAHASENDALMTWVATIAEDMKYIKHASDAELNFTPSEIKSNKEFWKSISFPDEFVKEKLIENETRKELPPPTPDYSIYGHYELLSVEQYVETLKYVGRLTKTNWSQEDSCNKYCPLKTVSPFGPAPAGCVPIAGAQMLYFLHNTFGVPVTAPSQAYCYGNIDNYYWAQYNFTSTVWNNMDKNTGNNAGPLVAHVGNLLGTNYGNEGSGSDACDLVYGVFEPYGIACIDNAYDTDSLTSSLLDSIPVILYADIQGTDIAHTFIADKYLRKRDVTKRTYYWVIDSTPPNIPIPILPNTYTYTYSSVNYQIGMNWGWGSDYNSDNEWFALTGDWHKRNDIFTDDNHRRMIYHFSVLY